MLDRMISNSNGKGKKAVYVWIGGIIFGLLFTILIMDLGPNLNHFIVTFLPFQEVSRTTGNFQPENFCDNGHVWAVLSSNQLYY